MVAFEGRHQPPQCAIGFGTMFHVVSGTTRQIDPSSLTEIPRPQKAPRTITDPHHVQPSEETRAPLYK